MTATTGRRTTRRATTAFGIFRRATASVAVISALVHAAMLRQHTDASAVALLLLALGCLGCAAMLWRSSGPHEWLIMMLLNAAMLTVHVLWWSPESAPDRMSHMNHRPHQGDGLTLMHAALALAVAELCAAVVGLFSELAPDWQTEITRQG
ncbi:hypothetical protein ACWCQQ_44205 [Streptomyces sp. NPDC002143]